MYNFKEYLEEGRDAPLYHGTMPDSIIPIMKSNMLRAETQQFMGKNIKMGVSLTRNINIAHQFATKIGIVFELDQRKLAYRHKMIPINWENATQNRGTLTRWHETTGRNTTNVKPITINEYEEFVVGPIKNLNDYIIKIHAKDDIFYNEEYLNKSFAIFMKHPKLYVDRKFVNG